MHPAPIWDELRIDSINHAVCNSPFVTAVDAGRRYQHTGWMTFRLNLTRMRTGTGKWVGTALLYGGLLASGAFLLEWIDYKYRAMTWSTGFYVFAIALAFACLGAWIGHRLTARGRASDFMVNHAAIASLRLSGREIEVLGLLAEGCANKIVARRLGISPNTVKTHVTRLFEKLEVTSRTQAIARARGLGVIP